MDSEREEEREEERERGDGGEGNEQTAFYGPRKHRTFQCQDLRIRFHPLCRKVRSLKRRRRGDLPHGAVNMASLPPAWGSRAM